jgi:hypothetical protein
MAAAGIPDLRFAGLTAGRTPAAAASLHRARNTDCARFQQAAEELAFSDEIGEEHPLRG